MRRATTVVVVLATAALSVSACGGGSSGGSKPDGSVSTVAKFGVAYDFPGKGDKAVNDTVAQGVARIKKEYRLCDDCIKELSGEKAEPASVKVQRLRQLAQQGLNPVIATGFSYLDAVTQAAKEFPKTKFAIVGDSASGSNVTNLVFAENEGSYLVGAAAALKSKTGKVGFIGNCAVEPVQQYEAGFVAGVKAANPKVTVDVKYLAKPPACTAGATVDAGRKIAEGVYAGGADVVYTSPGEFGSGVLAAAKAKNASVIGAGDDLYQSASKDLQPAVLTSMVNKSDVAVYEYVKSFIGGDPLTGTQSFDLRQDGVGYATSGGRVDDIKTTLDGFAEKIRTGEIAVPVKPGA